MTKVGENTIIWSDCSEFNKQKIIDLIQRDIDISIGVELKRLPDEKGWPVHEATGVKFIRINANKAE
jgi:predicted TIM-barrel enzyme